MEMMKIQEMGKVVKSSGSPEKGRYGYPFSQNWDCHYSCRLHGFIADSLCISWSQVLDVKILFWAASHSPFVLFLCGWSASLNLTEELKLPTCFAIAALNVFTV